jgi:hypothetical protein
MANYSFEKGKYGGPCGAIFPFFREIQGVLPTEEDYKNYVPAGFLRCRGQILQANQFPQLADTLGVGNNCIYKKTGVVLSDRDADGSGGTFQLPDLGSKYISSAGNPGAYTNDTAVNTTTNATVQRAGVSVELTSNGDTIDFTYTGSFRSPGVSALSFSGQWRAVSPPSKTPTTTLGISSFVGHGHRATHTIGASINLNSLGMSSAQWAGRFFGGGVRCWQPATVVCTANDNFGLTFVSLEITEAGVESSHYHQLSSPTVNVSYSGNIPPALMSASNIVTTVNIRTQNLFKMDDISPKFIICEYLIKY